MAEIGMELNFSEISSKSYASCPSQTHPLPPSPPPSPPLLSPSLSPSLTHTHTHTITKPVPLPHTLLSFTLSPFPLTHSITLPPPPPFKRYHYVSSSHTLSSTSPTHIDTHTHTLSYLSLPRQRDVVRGQCVHLPERRRGNVGHLLRRHRGGAVDRGGRESPLGTTSTPLLCHRTIHPMFLMPAVHKDGRGERVILCRSPSLVCPGCGGEDGLRPSTAVSGSLRMEADVCVADARRQDKQVKKTSDSAAKERRLLFYPNPCPIWL